MSAVSSAVVRALRSPFFDRVTQLVGVLALVAIVIVYLNGTFKDSAQNADIRVGATSTRTVACATAQFASAVGDRFRTGIRQAQERIGTPDERPTDRRGIRATQDVLAALDHLAEAVNPICGPVVKPRPTKETR